MLSVKLQGGIGNILFQIAFLESMGKEHGVEVCYANLNEWLNTVTSPSLGWSPNPQEILDYLPNIDFHKNRNERVLDKVDVPFPYSKVALKDNSMYVGYFQSEKFFYSKDFVKDLFTFRDKMDTIPKSCSIHVRRGNYLLYADHHPPLDMSYYNRAINYLTPMADTFYVFSNDIPWCRENFVGDSFVFVEEKDYIALNLMTRCTHHIMANSSFSWFGSWLGETKESLVIAPKIWFGEAIPKEYDTDLVPDRWLRI